MNAVQVESQCIILHSLEKKGYLVFLTQTWNVITQIKPSHCRSPLSADRCFDTSTYISSSFFMINEDKKKCMNLKSYQDSLKNKQIKKQHEIACFTNNLTIVTLTLCAFWTLLEAVWACMHVCRHSDAGEGSKVSAAHSTIDVQGSLAALHINSLRSDSSSPWRKWRSNTQISSSWENIVLYKNESVFLKNKLIKAQNTHIYCFVNGLSSKRDKQIQS